MGAFLLSEGMSYRSLVYNGVLLKFSIIGVAKGFEHYTPFKKGSLSPVHVVSILEQRGVNEFEIASCFDDFQINGHLYGEDCEKFRNYFDTLSSCFFTGRINSVIGGISYQQTFYVFLIGKLSKGEFNSVLSRFGVR